MAKLKKYAVALALSSLALASSATFAQDMKCTNNGTISVIGSGEVKVLPDQAKLEYRVTAVKPSADEARNAVETIVTTFSKQVASLNLTDMNFVANSLNIYPRYEYDNDAKKQNLIGYEASRSVFVTIEDFSLIGSINDVALKSGINQVAGYEYLLKDQSMYEKEAAQKAIADAKERAILLAEGFEVKLDAPCSLSFERTYQPTSFRLASAPVADSASNQEYTYTLEPLVIKSSVNAVFAIKGKSKGKNPFAKH